MIKKLYYKFLKRCVRRGYTKINAKKVINRIGMEKYDNLIWIMDEEGRYYDE